MPTTPRITTYQQFLRGLTDGAMSVIKLVAQAASPEKRDPRVIDGVRSFCWLSAIIRRAVVISRYLDTIQPPAEERHGKVMAALDWVLPFFAQHKIELESYVSMIDGELNDEPDESGLFEPDPESDVQGRRPVVLVAELCRDFGMAVHDLPPEWLVAVPDEVRLYCARAAVAGIDFAARPRQAVRHRAG